MNGILFDNVTVKLVPESFAVTSTWKGGIAYDSPLVKAVHDYLKDIENPVLLDVGASVGSFALLGVALPTLWVTAFEPNPVAARILGRNVQLNGLEPRVKIMTCALWSEDGKATLTVPDDPIKAGLATIGQAKRFTEGHKVTVEARKLDGIVGMEHVDFIKVDAEGAELFILKGGERFIKAHRPVILAEYYKPNTMQFSYEPKAIKDLLTSWGYSGHKRGKEDLWMTYGRQ